MIKTLTARTGAAALLALLTATAAAAENDPVHSILTGDTLAWSITEDLTTEIGPRQAGTDAEARARVWAVARLKAMGFANVREEPFTMPTWVRGEERANITSPYVQPLSVTALGNSGATPTGGLTGDIVWFASIDALIAAPEAAVRGKIVFIDHKMIRTQDGSSYGQYGRARFIGPNVAAKKGAAAILIRSIGTDSHRTPHTGNTNFDAGVTPIPAAAVSNPDADNIARMWRRTAGKAPLRVQMLLTPRNLGMQTSGNVIAEVTGRNPALPPIVIACHLDSWDLGTGAIDDAAGCAIITAAAKHVMEQGQPLRTIRLLWAGAEEVGVWGGKAYGEAHKGTPHALAMESDFGAGRVWRVDVKLADADKPLRDALVAALMPLGITAGRDPASGGADVGAIIAAQNLAVVDLQQDGSDYFDLHHTADDTLDKIDPAALRQNVAAWTASLMILANAESIGSPTNSK